VPAAPSARRARSAQTRTALLDAARRALPRFGWERARVEDVCREAGVGRGTFYAHFANKAELLEAMVSGHAQALWALAEAPSAEDQPRASVRRIIDGFVSLQLADRDIRGIWYAAASTEPRLAAMIEEVREAFVRRVGRRLELASLRQLTRGGLDIEMAATALTAMVEQTVALAGRRLDDAAERARVVDGLTELWVAAAYRDAAA
jgi:AcrR family transcriptional regulator